MAEVSSLGKWENVEEKEATQETELAEVEIWGVPFRHFDER